MAVARIEVEFDEKGAVQRVQRLDATVAKANAAQKVAAGQLRREMQQANNAAQLLGGTLGVQLPREVNKFLGQSKLIGPLLGAAFNVSILAAFGVGMIALIPKIKDLAQEWGGYTEGMKKQFADALAANETALRDFSTRGLGRIRIAETLEYLKGLEAEKAALEKRSGAMVGGIANIGAEIGLKLKLRELDDKKVVLDARLEAQLKRQDALNKEYNKTIETAAEKTGKLAEETAKLNREFEQGALDKWNEMLRLASDASIDAEAAVDKVFKKAGEDWRRDQEKQWGEFNSKVAEGAAASGGAWAKSVEEMSRKNEQEFEKMAGDIESFFDRVFLTARSFADVGRQLIMQFVGSIVKQFSRLLAGQLLGATGGGGGGGGILGALLGIGTRGGASAGVGAPALAGAAGFTAFGTSLPADFAVQPLTGAGAATIAGGATQGLGGALAFGAGGGGGLAGLAALAPLGIGLGGLLLGSKAFSGGRSPAGGALFGALGGAAIGTAIGAAFLGSLSLGALAFGPVGATIGAVVGLIAALVGRGKSKRKAAEMEQQYEFAAIDLLDSYKLHQTDFDGALSGMRLLIGQGREALLTAGLGKAGRRGADNLTMVIEEQIRLLKELERQRQSRAGIMGMMSLPEFAVGGQVPGAGNGILAILHPGEFVMRKSAVDSLGADFLSALNRAPRFAEGGTVGGRQSAAGSRTVSNTFNFYQQPGENQRAFGDRVIREVRRGRLEGRI